MGTGYVIPLDPLELSSRVPAPDHTYDEEEEDAGELTDAFLVESGYEERIAPLLDRIPPREADLIYLYFVEKKRQADIAAIFNVTQAAISYRLDRGIKRIKFLLSIPNITEEDLRRDLSPIFKQIDIDILVGMMQTTCQSEVANQLNLTQGRVRHRFFKAVKVLEKAATEEDVYKPYCDLFSKIADKNFNMLKSVILPQWANRGRDECL